MRNDELDAIEKAMEIELPADYRRVVVNAPASSDFLYDNAHLLISTNERIRRYGICGPMWTRAHFMFANGYAFDTSRAGPAVFRVDDPHSRKLVLDCASIDEWLEQRIRWYVEFDADDARRKYEPLIADIEAAGFFTAGVQPMDGWDRILAASHRMPNGKGLYGRSFWVTRLEDGWYLGTWGCLVYRVPRHVEVGAVCIAVLSGPDRARSDLAPELRGEFGLVEVDDDEFETLMNRARGHGDEHASDAQG